MGVGAGVLFAKPDGATGPRRSLIHGVPLAKLLSHTAPALVVPFLTSFEALRDRKGPSGALRGDTRDHPAPEILPMRWIGRSMAASFWERPKIIREAHGSRQKVLSCKPRSKLSEKGSPTPGRPPSGSKVCARSFATHSKRFCWLVRWRSAVGSG